jgi:hypothetical protein
MYVCDEYCTSTFLKEMKKKKEKEEKLNVYGQLILR